MTGTVKAIETGGEWLLDVLGVPFGGPLNGKDADGEYFDNRSKLWLDQIGKRAIVHYHGYDSAGNPASEPEIIGQELGYEVKQDGVWFRVLLDKGKDAARRIWEAAQNGMARASSGAIQHLVRRDDDGHIAIWPVGELSLMDMSIGNYPANPYAVAMPVLQKRFKAADLTLTIDESEAGAESQEGAGTPAEEEAQQLQEIPTMADEATPKPLTLEDVAAFLDKRDADKREAERIARLEAQAEELKALKGQIAEAQAARPGTEQIKKLPNPVQDPPAQQITVNSRYDGYSIGQLGLAYDMLKARGHMPSAELFRAIHTKAAKLVDSPAFFENHIVRNAKGEIMREFNPGESAQAAKAVKAINPMQMADTPATKANELMYSTQSTYGDEWVPALWSTELWDLVRNGAPVLSRFRQVEVPGESLTIPTLGGRTTVYKVAQSTDQADLNIGTTVNAVMTKAATGNVTLTPVKGMAWLSWSGEFAEDSIVPALPTLQTSLQMDLMEQIDEILISGDTDTSNTNISDTGNGSISANWHLLIANGLRDYALGNGNASDLGVLTVEDFLTVMGLLGTNGAFAIDPAKLFWLADPGFYRTAMGLGEMLTRDKNSAATVESGRLTKVFGSDFVVSDRYGKTDANGKIHNTTSNNTKGSVLLVRPDRWVVGFGRRIRIESPARDLVQIASDTQHLIASFRLDFKNNGEGSALGYNVTLVG